MACRDGFFDAPLSSLPSPAARLAANPQATGNGGGHDLHYRTLRKLGITLLGHFLGAEGGHARFALDLDDSVARGDQRYAQLMDLVRKLVAEHGLPPPEITGTGAVQRHTPDRLDVRGLRRSHLRRWIPARLPGLGALSGRLRRARHPQRAHGEGLYFFLRNSPIT